MWHTKFQVFHPRGSEEEQFWMFFLCISRLQTQDPLGGAIFYPRTFIWTNLVKDYLAMSDTKFKASEPSGSEEEDFWIFSMYFYGSNTRPLGQEHFGPGNHYLNKLGKGLLAKDAYMYQISST